MPRGGPRRPHLLLYYGGLKVEGLRSRIVSDAKKILNRRGRREHPQKIAEISCYAQAQILLAGHIPNSWTIKQKAKRPILPDRSASLVPRADARPPAQLGGRRKLPGSCLRPGPRRRCSRKIRDRWGRAGAAVSSYTCRES